SGTLAGRFTDAALWVGPKYRAGAISLVEPNDRDVHCGLAGSLGAPSEGAVGEPAPPSGGENWLPQVQDRLALADRVRGDERPSPIEGTVVIQCLAIPGRHVVQVDVVCVAPDVLHVRNLLL